ncbi:hypothetical protein AB0C22_26475 [Micromonospora sp. NPDC048894]|uniref:hypothetical protein n=1 Tax=Micromonospora sp. NPDC048894 TaxID=3155493 RepID=UPI003403CF65
MPAGQRVRLASPAPGRGPPLLLSAVQSPTRLNQGSANSPAAWSWNRARLAAA